MNTEAKQYLEEWIQKISEKQDNLNGFPICPFAKQGKHTIIECSICEIIPISGYDVIIYVVEQHLTHENLVNWVEIYNEEYSEWKFFEDSYSRNTYIQEIKTNNDKFNLIIAQPKAKLTKYREILAKTTYYDHWDQDYLKEILKKDINIISQGIETP